MNQITGLDTNILARYYVAADGDDAATLRQRAIARKLIESGRPLMIAKTVLLELEWVLRGYYKFSRDEAGQVFAHLLSLEQVLIEDRQAVNNAVANHAAGLDFADALHHASYSDCGKMASFDDRGFVGKSKKLNLAPSVTLPR